MLCRTSDRSADGARGALALARELGKRLDLEPRVIGSPGDPRDSHWEEDLRESRGCLLEAGGQIDDALAGNRWPMLLAGDCSICLTTIPAVLRHEPEAVILWLDAHADFNTPETTPSQFLGGMCLSGACGLWETGFDGPRLEPAKIVMCGVRDVDGGERVLLDTRGVVRVTRPSMLASHLRGMRVFVHLDLDVLDPTVLPAHFPAEGGLSDGGLRLLLAEVAEMCEIVGAEITCASADHAEMLGMVVEPLVG
jgi:arginase family enzyme